ncbi:MAG: aldo/keto reductase [Pseudomonadota bacterium]|nr:aldo/keto reductase [Pseudomonadota bacterium]
MNDPAFQFPLRLGFGCSGAWGMRWFPETEAVRLVAQAMAGGIRLFDTAGFYAGGEAERRLGAALKAVGENAFVSTKVGTRYRSFGPPLKDFSETAIRAAVEASLRRLRRERIDLLYLHGPSANALGEAAPLLSQLKKEGKIDRWGVCGEGAGLDQAIEAGAEAVMGVYNIFRSGHAAAFERAKEKGVGVFAIAPLAQGLYAPDFYRVRSLGDVWRIGRATVKNRAELRAARAARPVLEAAEGWTPAQLALAFVRANPSIDAALTTTTKPAHLAEVLAAPPDIPAGLLEKLGRLAT